MDTPKGCNAYITPRINVVELIIGLILIVVINGAIAG
jgi:hypothetical protein